MSSTEGDAMSNRILRTIKKIIENDQNIVEFDIIPTPYNLKNKSPVVYEDHSIGLESWCIKHIYNYACSNLFEYYDQLKKGKLSYMKMGEFNDLLIGALLINPHVTTFWNMKRELIERELLNVDDELYFSKIVISHKAKVSDAFAYRRWLLQRIINKMCSMNIEVPYTLLQNEFSVIHMASQKSPNNYHSWNHRIWCIENLAPKRQLQQIVYSELSYTQEWINNHISEHVGYHYRQYLITLTKKDNSISSVYGSFLDFVSSEFLSSPKSNGPIVAPAEVLQYLLGVPSEQLPPEEIANYTNYMCLMLYDLCILVDKLNPLFPEHEALYYHRRFLMYHLLNLPLNIHQAHQISDNANSGTKNSVVSIGSDMRANKWSKLFKVSSNRYEGYALCDLVLHCDKKFLAQSGGSREAERYRKWLSNVMGLK
ncbi:unnamed protein product [Callosobruchus maculatus]|uniref:Protein prenyltransferase alpha subunit repeat-containing protein 1 n=1 Tax=Callosobruchus maculatus TaxID=64391 RepID=A0A653DKN6_CALMS|nr:unnamed protein product [Callosobruchus maculatus]